jgi:peptide/nickel transport system substrate-binding protein
MFTKKIAISTFIFLISMVLIITACGPASIPTPQTVVETSVVTEILEATPTEAATVEVIQVVTPTPEPESPRTLVICQGQEPDTLWLYGGNMLAAAHINEMIYDGFDNGPYGGLDQVNFGYEPVIMEKIPSLADGDAVLGSAAQPRAKATALLTQRET